MRAGRAEGIYQDLRWLLMDFGRLVIFYEQ